MNEAGVSIRINMTFAEASQLLHKLDASKDADALVDEFHRTVADALRVVFATRKVR